MGKKLSTFYKDNSDELCELHVDLKEEFFYIKYYKSKEAVGYFHYEEYKKNSLSYVEDAAENWALGIKDLDPDYEGTLL